MSISRNVSKRLDAKLGTLAERWPNNKDIYAQTVIFKISVFHFGFWIGILMHKNIYV